MKRLILCAALALSSIPGLAQSCDEVGLLARGVMENRQLGVPIEDIMKIAEGSSDPKARELTIRLTMAAYEKPAYRTETMRTHEIRTFGNWAAHACYKGLEQRKR